MSKEPDEIIGDDGDREILCKHGVGHSYEVHTCDGCCFGDANFAQRMLIVFGPPKDDFPLDTKEKLG